MARKMSIKAEIKLSCIFTVLAISVLLALMLFYLLQNNKPAIEDYTLVDSSIGIYPDYSDTVIPPNIAPLNFYIKEPAEGYYVRIYSQEASPITINSKISGIRIPFRKWQRLLSKNKGNNLYFEIFTRKGGSWYRYKPLVNKIAKEKIDSFLVFRSLIPKYYQKARMHIYQRNLANYSRALIIDQEPLDGCFNCHSFLNKKSQKFIIQARHKGKNYMILSSDGKVSLITPRLRKSGSAYLSWHPSGKIVAITANMKHKVFLFLAGYIPEERMEFLDYTADLALYNIETNTVTTTPAIAREDRIEMQPEWSPDGKYLYFISAPKVAIEKYRDVKYDLMRIKYDIGKDAWGEPEVIIASYDTGLGVTFPKVSPDNRYLLFCMTDRASFSILRAKTDLYLMDLETCQYRKLEINSDRTDSYHSWSSNSHWFVFTSKRDDGIFGKAYFSYVDDKGKVYRPFVLPQKDPYFYDTFMGTYNVPELIREPIKINRFSFARKITAVDKIITSHIDKDLINTLSIDIPETESVPDYLH